MDIRKVQRSGNSSFIVSLPMEWVTAHGIKKNHPLEMETNSDGSITIFPVHMPSSVGEARTIAITQKTNQNFLLREMIGAYISGHQTIELTSAIPFSAGIRNLVSNFIELTVGQEVVEEDDHKITIKDILNPSEMPMEKTVRRMYTISKKMVCDSVLALETKDKELNSQISKMDDEVDRLCWLVARKHNMFLGYPSIARKEELSLKSSNLFFLTARSIERISDHAVRISKYSPTLMDDPRAESVMKTLVESGKISCSVYEKSFKAMLGRDAVSANSIVEEIAGMDRDYDKLLSKEFKKRAEISIPMAYIVEGLRRICDYSAGICENVINYRD